MSGNSNANVKMDSNKASADAKMNSNNSNAQSGSVTRSIKGKKEVVFDLAELKGKGYPAPVGMNASK